MVNSLVAERTVRGELFGTDVTVSVFFPLSVSSTEREIILDECFAIFQNIHNRFSRFIKENELWWFNHSTGGVVSKDLWRLLVLCRTFWHRTSGIFDPTILTALVKEGYKESFLIWGKRVKETSNPFISSPSTPLFSEKISSPSVPLPGGDGRSLCTFSSLVFDTSVHSITKPSDVFIDLGGIGKGYAVDCVSNYLKKKGLVNFCVDAGGDLFCSGSDTQGKTNCEQSLSKNGWSVTIESPHDESQVIGDFILSDMAMATSGTNRRHWVSGGKEKHHLIDPKAKKSATTDLLSATVIAKTTTEADVYAKTCVIMGKEHAMVFAEKNHLPCVLVPKKPEEMPIVSPWGKGYIGNV